MAHLATLRTDHRPGDIWVHRGIAWLGSYTCGKGPLPVDVSDPAHPLRLPLLSEETGSTAEDVMVIAAQTELFSGDLLAAGLQSCRDGGPHGAEFWDVTDPSRPVRLSFFDSGPNTRGVHELHLFQRGASVYALLAVPSSELTGNGGDLRIVDVTDPRRPVQVADWGARAKLGAATLARGASPSVYCHSAWTSQDGTVAYLSYWDAGVVLLDISDPAAPKYLGRTTYGPGEEGDAHSAWPINDRNLLLVADEDFWPRGILLEVESATVRGPMRAIEANLSAPSCGAGEIVGELVIAGRGCPSDQFYPDVRGRVALVDFGACPAREQVLRAQQGGAAAVLVAGDNSGRLPTSLGGDGSGISIPAAMISKADGDSLKGAIAARQLVRAILKPDPKHTWGYLRVFDIADPTAPAEVGSFATPEARRCPAPDGGTHTIHNPFVANDGAVYLSWYSDGVRALDLTDPANPREIAAYVPPTTEEGAETMIWGVYAEGGLVFLSDMNQGLHVLRRVTSDGRRERTSRPTQPSPRLR